MAVGSISGQRVDLSNVSGVLPVENGGTGQNTLAGVTSLFFKQIEVVTFNLTEGVKQTKTLTQSLGNYSLLFFCASFNRSGSYTNAYVDLFADEDIRDCIHTTRLEGVGTPCGEVWIAGKTSSGQFITTLTNIDIYGSDVGPSELFTFGNSLTAYLSGNDSSLTCSLTLTIYGIN